MEEPSLIDYISAGAEMMACSVPWKLHLLFGALKRYRYWFWTNEDIRNINDEYHEDLEKFNGFPVKMLNVFRRRSTGIEVNSFFIDLGKDPLYLVGVISSATLNLNHLCEIIYLCDETRDLKKGTDLFSIVNDYMDKEIKNQTIQKPPYDNNVNYFHNTFLYKNTNDGKKIIEDSYSRTTVIAPDEENGVIFGPWLLNPDFRPEIIIYETKLVFKDAEHVDLNQKASDILNNNLEGIDEIELDTCINLVENFECFVEKRNYKRFLKELVYGKMMLESIFPSIGIEYCVELIKKYYRTGIVHDTDEKIREEQEQKTIKDFEELYHHADGWNKTAGIYCYFFDILGYFYKKKCCFLDRNAYIDANAVMRYLVRESQPDWYCFDPEYYGQWASYLTDDGLFIDAKKDKDLMTSLRAIIEKNISINSSLIVEAFNIASNEHNFKEAVRLIDKAIRKHKKDIKEKKKFF